MAKDGEASAIILFDGDCALCSGSVQFVIRHDPRGRFRFAPLRSPTGRALLAGRGVSDAQLPDSVILLEDGELFTESTAALHIARHLSGWPRWLTFLRFVPRAVRDLTYRLVAANRRRWLGTPTRCLLPSPELRARLLDDGRAGRVPG